LSSISIYSAGISKPSLLYWAFFKAANKKAIIKTTGTDIATAIEIDILRVFGDY
jgi:hypothetical protein